MAISGAKAQLRAVVSIPKILQVQWALSAVWDSTNGSANTEVMCVMGLCTVGVLFKKGIWLKVPALPVRYRQGRRRMVSR